MLSMCALPKLAGIRKQLGMAMAPVVAALIMSPVGAQETEAETAAYAVDLNFDWSVGWIADVQTLKTRTRRHFLEDATPRGITVDYTMTVQNEGEHIVVSYGDPVATNNLQDPRATLRSSMSFSGMVTDHTISSAGEFLGVTNVDAVSVRMEQLLQTQMPQTIPAQLSAMIKRMTSAEGLQAMTGSEWDSLVGQWIGQSMEPNEDYAAVSAVAHPTIPGANVEFTSLINLEEGVACDPGETIANCVRISVFSSADLEEIGSIMKRFADSAGDSEEAKTISEISFNEFSDELVLVTDPQTLRPYRYEHTRTLDLTSESKGRDGRIDHRVTTFKYR